MRLWNRRIALVLGLLVLLAFGYQLWNASRQVASLWDYVLQPPAPQATAEVAALRAQLEVMRQYDQRLLETVYWALAVIVVIAALLVGFGWYANFRVYERDKTIMHQDLRNSLEKATAESRQALAAEVRKEAEQASSKIAGDLKSKINSLTSVVSGFQYERAMAEADRWEKRVPANAIISYIDAAECAFDAHTVPLGLENALDGIVRLLETRASVDSYVIRRLKAVLDRLPVAHADVGKKIRSLAGIPT